MIYTHAHPFLFLWHCLDVAFTHRGQGVLKSQPFCSCVESFPPDGELATHRAREPWEPAQRSAQTLYGSDLYGFSRCGLLELPSVPLPRLYIESPTVRRTSRHLPVCGMGGRQFFFTVHCLQSSLVGRSDEGTRASFENSVGRSVGTNSVSGQRTHQVGGMCSSAACSRIRCPKRIRMPLLDVSR